MHILDSINYIDLHNEFVEVEKWLNNRSIATNKSTFDEVKLRLRDLASYHEKGQLKEIITPENSKYYVAALLNSIAYINIKKEFMHLKDHELPRRALRTSLQAPFFINDESPSLNNIDSRNTLFELELASRILRNDIKVINFDDFTFEFKEKNFNVQCKRIFSKARIGNNISKAYEQLACRLQDHNDRGIIALSLEKVTDGFDGILQINDINHLQCHLDKAAGDFIKNHKHHWEIFIDQRVIGLFLILPFAMELKSTGNITRGFQVNAVCLARSDCFQGSDVILLKEVCAKIANK